MKYIIFRSILLLLLLTNITALKAQTTTDTLGSTIVEISVALDTSHFEGGYLSGPWDLYWGPDQKLWYTNKKMLCRYDPSTQVADTILTLSTGYILAVTAHGDFFNQPYVYLTIDTADYYGQGQIIRLFRYEYSLAGDSLYNPQFLLQWYHPGEHSGGRIIYGADDKLYVSTAEYWVGYDTLFNNSGKVLRINPDGTVPLDNPRADYTFTYGHRNPQGIVQVPNGNIFVSEYGQQWDELNLLEVNRYYGWMIYDGINCFGNQDSCDYYDSTAVFPVDAALNPPSGIDFYDHPAIPELNGLVQAVTGFLKQGLIVYTMNAAYDSVILKSYFLTQEYGRVRDACAAPDGSLYFIAHDRSTADVHVIRNPLYNSYADVRSAELFTFYPNPSSGTISFRINNRNTGTLTLTDLPGHLIYSQQVSEPHGTFDVSAIPGGCYLLTFKTAYGETSSKKMIIVK